MNECRVFTKQNHEEGFWLLFKKGENNNVMPYKNKKDKENIVFAPWRHDEKYKPEKGKKAKCFVALPHSLLMNNRYINLKASTQKIYTYMTSYANGGEYTKFPKSIYTKITTTQTFNTAIKELIENGFIEIEVHGKNTRTENLYRFIDKWKKD